MIVGPSYTLNARKADVQRCVNLMPTPLEAPGGKSQMYLAPVPGLRQFGTDDVALATTRFFTHGIQGTGPAEILTSAVIAARDEFLSNLTGYEVEDCEGLDPIAIYDAGGSPTFTADPDGVDPTLTFGAITCTTEGLYVVSDPFDTRSQGRMNTTTAGSKWVESRPQYDIDFNLLTTMPLTTFTFSGPIAAFGAYVSDIDDFGTAIRVWVTASDGKRYQLNFPENYAGTTPDTSIAFFGFICRGMTFTKVEVARNDNMAFYNSGSTSWEGTTGDQIGFDDIIIATAAQVGTFTGYPNPWTTSYGLERWLALHFNALVTGEVNEFYDSGEFGLVGSIRAIDSAADSATAGTWVTDGDFHGKAYACIGERVTLTLPSLTSRGGNGFLSRAGITVEFEFKRTGSRVGTGEIVHVANLISVRCNASHQIEATITLADTTTLTFNGSTTLASGTKYKVRVMCHRDASSGFYRFGIYINGVSDYDSQDTYALYSSSAFGTGTISAVVVGGKDASNYTPGIIDEVSCSNTLPDLFANFSPPAAPFREIYPPGYTTSPDVEAA